MGEGEEPGRGARDLLMPDCIGNSKPMRYGLPSPSMLPKLTASWWKVSCVRSTVCRTSNRYMNQTMDRMKVLSLYLAWWYMSGDAGGAALRHVGAEAGPGTYTFAQ